MGRLIEIIRRLAVVIVWLIGGFAGGGMIIEGTNKTSGGDEMVSVGVVILIGTFVLHKVVNWILLKDEKKPH